MSIQENLSRATAVAKWKADQQMRLLKNQNQIRDLEGQLKTQKARLADTAWTLYAQQLLSEDELKEICAVMVQLQEQIHQQQVLQEAIKNEQLPDQTNSATPAPSTQPGVGVTQNLCPNCRNSIELQWKVCPRCGAQLK
ncbi:hypothetical protein [Candidatus Amarolinea aalborgensis]|uniref:hypothetical protein n=1 Tax=Candidatus Amarolinea aalborgensis TaxID=2249329 RepID=UPI003BFA2BD4